MTGKAAFESNFKFKVRDTFFLPYVQVTVVLPYRIHDFLRTELFVRNLFKCEVFHLRAAMKT